MIATSELNTREIQLACNTRRNRAKTTVEYVHPSVPDRGADGHQNGVVCGDSVIGDVDGCFRRSVEVVQLRIRKHRAEPRSGVHRQCFTRCEHVVQRRRALCCRIVDEHFEHRWHEVRDRHVVRLDQFGQILGIPMTVRHSDDETRADLQRPEQLPDRHVEGDRGLLQHRIGSAEWVLRLHPSQAVHDGTMTDRDALGAARRSRCEDDVREVIRLDGRRALFVGDRPARHCCGVDRVDGDHTPSRRRHRVTCRTQNAHRICCVKDVLDAFGRLIQVHRHVRTTGSKDCVDRDK